MIRLFLSWITLVLLACSTSGFAQEPSANSKKISVLEKRIEQLEARERNESSASASASGTATGLSRTFNPAISVHGLLLGSYVSEGNGDTDRETKTGMKVQEVEVNFSANVDTWLRADLTLAIEGVEEVEVEELIAQGLISRDLSLRAGKFFTPFGKHNLLHTHSYPFIDAPLINEEILGEEGLNEIGIGVDYLLPTPWFSSLSLQFLEGENALFDGPENDDFLYLAHWKNLVDLTPELTAELGGSFAHGKNGDTEDDDTDLFGADLTFKWKPAGRERYRTLVWQSEYLLADRDERQEGFYTLARYQFTKRWWAQGRYDFLNTQLAGQEEYKHRYSTLLAFVASEYTAIRLQYNYLDQFQENNEHQVLMQLNFTLGSHPAHSY